MRALNYPSGHTLSEFLPWSNCEDFEIFIWSKGRIIPQGMTHKDLELRFERQIMPRLIEIWARGNSAGSYSLQPPTDDDDYGFFDFEGHENRIGPTWRVIECVRKRERYIFRSHVLC